MILVLQAILLRLISLLKQHTYKTEWCRQDLVQHVTGWFDLLMTLPLAKVVVENFFLEKRNPHIASAINKVSNRL